MKLIRELKAEIERLKSIISADDSQVKLWLIDIIDCVEIKKILPEKIKDVKSLKILKVLIIDNQWY